MKKGLLALLFTSVLFFSTNLEAQAYEIPSNETEDHAPITRWWYQTEPIPHQGQYKFVKTARFGQCLKGYVSARYVMGYLYIYEGYLYPCDGTIPIPSEKKSTEEESK